MNEYILGFSSRPADLGKEQEWNDQRRAAYLIRPEVALPFSVDTSVWPSIIQGLDLSTGQRVAQTMSETDFHEQALHLSTDLERLTQLTKAGPDSERASLICVTLLSEQDVIKDQWWSMAFAERTIPNKINPAWNLAGYDVADQYLTSGLSNCGYSPSVISQVRAEWTEDVNEFGLLKSMNSAIRFREFTDNRVSQHAPFYIFGVYIVGQ